MRNGTLSRLCVIAPWICMTTFVSLLLLSAPASAITESNKGTVLNLQDDAYLVPEAFLYQVKGNDNLHWLAAKSYGDARHWVRIYQANQEKVLYPSPLRQGVKPTHLTNWPRRRGQTTICQMCRFDPFSFWQS